MIKEYSVAEIIFLCEKGELKWTEDFIKKSDVINSLIEWHDLRENPNDLPKDNEFVFAYWEFDHGAIAQYYDNGWWIDNDYDDGPPPLFWFKIGQIINVLPILP